MSEASETIPRIYMAGPDIYHPRAEEIAANKNSSASAMVLKA